jgi:hypothetical protein
MLPFASREPLLQQQCWPLPGRHKTIVAILQRHLHSEPISHVPPNGDDRSVLPRADYLVDAKALLDSGRDKTFMDSIVERLRPAQDPQILGIIAADHGVTVLIIKAS